jgi:hypothetical protein
VEAGGKNYDFTVDELFEAGASWRDTAIPHVE